MSRAARSAFDVAVVDEPNETFRATGVSWLLGAVSLLFGEVEGGVPVRVKVQILSTGIGDPLKDWIEYPRDADLLKNKIQSDLDQMDADTFAAEWGLPPEGA
jgi:hypothetical protein